MIEDTSPPDYAARDLTLEHFPFAKPPYYRVTHRGTGRCLEAPTAREAVDAINSELSQP